MLSRLASQFAAEIALHDWSDAPHRADRAGHDRDVDSNSSSEQLTQKQTAIVRLNVIWVTAQVLAYNDPNFDIVEYAHAAGDDRTPKGWLEAGLRGSRGVYNRPGTHLTDEEQQEQSVEDLLVEHRNAMARVQALLDEVDELRPA